MSQAKDEAKLGVVRKKVETIIKQYVAGRKNLTEVRRAIKDLEKANEKVHGVNLDFYSEFAMMDRREKRFSQLVNGESLHHIDRTTWKAIKKEAGLKKSGFLKKSDANVGKYITKYRSAYSKFANSRSNDEPDGDQKLLKTLISAAVELQKALKKFVAAKDFKSDLAKDLQKKCNDFISDLESELKDMRELVNADKEKEQFWRDVKKELLIS